MEQESCEWLYAGVLSQALIHTHVLLELLSALRPLEYSPAQEKTSCFLLPSMTTFLLVKTRILKHLIPSCPFLCADVWKVYKKSINAFDVDILSLTSVLLIDLLLSLPFLLSQLQFFQYAPYS